MLAHLDPSVELTGGPWYTDNELDTEFIKLLCNACLRLIQDKVLLSIFLLEKHNESFLEFPKTPYTPIPTGPLSHLQPSRIPERSECAPVFETVKNN